MEAVLASLQHENIVVKCAVLVFTTSPNPHPVPKTKITDVPFPDCSAVRESNRYLSENGTN